MFLKNLRKQLPAAFLLALLVTLSLVLPVFAHHTDYEVSLTCDEKVKADAEFVGGDSRRVIVLTNVVVNGEPYDPSWSQEAPGDGFVPLSEYNGPQGGLVVTGTQYVINVVHPGFDIFNYTADQFNGEEGDWDGTIIAYSVRSGGNLEQASATTHVTAPELPEGCAPPDVEVIYVCDLNGFEARFRNRGYTAITLEWWAKGFYQGEVPLEGHETVVKTFPIAEGETIEVVVEGPFGYREVLHVTRNCQGSEASLLYNCTMSGVLLRVNNTSTQLQEHQIGATGVPTETVVIEPMSQLTRTFAIEEDTTITVTVVGPYNFSFTESVERDCVDEPQPPLPANPKVEMGEVCKNAGQSLHVVYLQNLGNLPVTFFVYYDDPTTPDTNEFESPMVFEFPGVLAMQVTLTLPEKTTDHSRLLITNSVNDEVVDMLLNGCEQPTALNPDDQPDEPEEPELDEELLLPLLSTN